MKEQRRRTKLEIEADRAAWRSSAEAVAQESLIDGLDQQRKNVDSLVTLRDQIPDKMRKKVAKALRDFSKAAIDAAGLLDPK